MSLELFLHTTAMTKVFLGGGGGAAHKSHDMCSDRREVPLNNRRRSAKTGGQTEQLTRAPPWETSPSGCGIASRFLRATEQGRRSGDRAGARRPPRGSCRRWHRGGDAGATARSYGLVSTPPASGAPREPQAHGTKCETWSRQQDSNTSLPAARV